MRDKEYASVEIDEEAWDNMLVEDYSKQGQDDSAGAEENGDKNYSLFVWIQIMV